jgi:hypothetical protein
VLGETAGIVYKFYADRTLADLLGDLAGSNDAPSIVEAIRKLLRILHVWHSSRISTYFDLLADEYPLDNVSLDQFEQYAEQDLAWGVVRDARIHSGP